jgi:hypothetical protein
MMVGVVVSDRDAVNRPGPYRRALTAVTIGRARRTYAYNKRIRVAYIEAAAMGCSERARVV